MIRTYHLLTYCIVSIFCAIGLIVCPADAIKVGEWRVYGSDKASTKYVPVDRINKDNVRNLQVAWRWNSPDNALVESNPDLWTMVNEAIPLMIGGVIYTSTSLNQVAAIKAATGETIWVYARKPTKMALPPIQVSCIAVSPIGRTVLLSASSLVREMGISSCLTPKRENQYKGLARMVASI